MNLRERATALLQQYTHNKFPATTSDLLDAMLAFAAEVREEERKRCAEIAENYYYDDGGATASAIARIIKQEPR